MLTVGRWLLFLISAGALLTGAERLSSRVTVAGDLRIAATGALTAAVAVAETLLFGTVGLGGNAVVLAAAAVATGVIVCAAVPPSDVRSTTIARDGWRRLDRASRAVLGAAAAVVAVDAIYLIGRPAIGTDGLVYHLAEPAMWVTDGNPGSMHATISGLPIQAYPKSGEVLFSWAIGTARTPIATTLVMVGAVALAAVCGWSALRRLGVRPWVAGSLTAAVVCCPVTATQLAGPNTDLLTLTWVLCTGALCVGALLDSGLFPIAVVGGGLAMGTKTTAIPIVVTLLVVTAWRLRSRVWRHRLALVLASSVTVGIGLVWYIRDLVVYQAPFYPFSRFPSGPPVPAVISKLGARFLSHPAAAVRTATAKGYAHGLGGALILAAGTVVVIALLPFVRDRRLRLGIAVAAGAALLEALIWSIAPFTGVAAGFPSRALVLGGIRYLLPGLPLFALAIGLASRASGLVGRIAAALAAAAVLADVWADRAFQAGARPPAVALVAAAVAGALAAELAGRVPHWRVGALRLVPALAVAAVVVGGLSAATPGYLDRHISVARTLRIGAPDVLAILQRQPRWSEGHLPVATGPVADAMFAGPTFNHPISVITERTSCVDVRAATRTGWVILPTDPAASSPGATVYDRGACLAGIRPLFTSDRVAVFAPTGR